VNHIVEPSMALNSARGPSSLLLMFPFVGIGAVGSVGDRPCRVLSGSGVTVSGLSALQISAVE